MVCVIPMLLLALSASPAAAQVACTQIGCVDGLTLAVPPEYRWQPGKYQFAFMLDSASLRCEGALPFASCEGNLRCSGAGVMITESGCMLPQGAHGFGDIQIPSAPAEVQLTITRDGQSVAQGAWKPQYTTSHPNGQHCAPACRQARVEVEMLH